MSLFTNCRKLLQLFNGPFFLYGQLVCLCLAVGFGFYYGDEYFLSEFAVGFVGVLVLLMIFTAVIQCCGSRFSLPSWAAFLSKTHVKTFVRIFSEIAVVWGATMLKEYIPPLTKGEFVTLVSAFTLFYFFIVACVEILPTTRDLGIGNATISVLVFLLNQTISFGCVPVIAIVVYLKNIAMAECCQTCREAKLLKRQKSTQEDEETGPRR